MEPSLLTEDLDAFLFGSGLTINDYAIEQGPNFEVITYKSGGGEYDLNISHDGLAIALIERLKELGVQIKKYE